MNCFYYFLKADFPKPWYLRNGWVEEPLMENSASQNKTWKTLTSNFFLWTIDLSLNHKILPLLDERNITRWKKCLYRAKNLRAGPGFGQIPMIIVNDFILLLLLFHLLGSSPVLVGYSRIFLRCLRFKKRCLIFPLSPYVPALSYGPPIYLPALWVSGSSFRLHT